MGEVVAVETSDKDLIDDFVTDSQIRGLTEGTIQSYLSPINIFKDFIHQHGTSLPDADGNDLKRYIQHLREKDRSQKTIENHFSALSSFYDYLSYDGIIPGNPVTDVRKRYLRRYKKQASKSQRKLVTIEEMSMFLNAIIDPRDKALCTLLAKTGRGRKEVSLIDIGDIDWDTMSITMKPTAKRTNRLVYFDGECARILRKWLQRRDEIAASNESALFVGYTKGKRLQRSGIYNNFIHWATKVGLHDPDSDKLEDHFTPHCCRHWFTTMLLRAGMRREHVKELRGDARSEAIDIYHHIDREDLRKQYLACIPQLGLE